MRGPPLSEDPRGAVLAQQRAREVLRPSLGSPHTPRRVAAEGPGLQAATKPATLDNPRSARRLFIRPKTRSLLCSDSSPGVLVLEGQPGVAGRKSRAEQRKRSRHFQLEILNTHRTNLLNGYKETTKVQISPTMPTWVHLLSDKY